MWELSGHSESEYTIWGFDGRIFRGHVAVFGAPKAFNYMADAMATFQTRGSNRYECRAVLSMRKRHGISTWSTPTASITVTRRSR